MTVRMAKQQDLEQMTDLAFDFFMESGQPGEFSEVKTEVSLAAALHSPDYFVMVSEGGGRVSGMVVGFIGPTLFSDDLTAIEICWYMDKSFRNTKDALLLLKGYEKWATDKGATVVSLTYLDKVQDLTKLYERKGYTLSECGFTKEV